MILSLSDYQEFHKLGLAAIPIKWDEETKKAVGYPEHGEVTGVPSIEFTNHWINYFKQPNGVALKLFPPYGMFDFDLKNTEKKEIFTEWFKAISLLDDDILKKICIEKTRSGGFHVYIKYAKLSHKIPLARSKDGEEVISIYTGGLLSFCDPTPNYQVFHNEWGDIDYLTDEQFDIMVTSASFFNESKEYKSGDTRATLDAYPLEYESMCLKFDSELPVELFEQLLNDINLYRVDSPKYKRKDWTPFLRKGSTADYSAKVYMHSRKVMIFSASMQQFPTWQDRTEEGDNNWVLKPSKIIFYKNNRNWLDAIEEIKMIADSAGLSIAQEEDVPYNVKHNRLLFPYDIFPDDVVKYISYHRIQHEYIAGAMFMAIATAIGNSVRLQAMQGYMIKPIFYMAIVSPAGGGKSPALDRAFEPLESFDKDLYSRYANAYTDYSEKLKLHKQDKKSNEEPTPPILSQTLIKDSTIEMVVKILSNNPCGCCLVADELIGFINRMNQYKAGDDVQKWLELWNGSPVLLQRISREDNKVQDPHCNIVGGIQVGVLDTLSKDEKEHNGFYHRFLFVYPVPEDKQDWGQMNMPPDVIMRFNNYFDFLLSQRTNDKRTYYMSPEAEAMYAEWFNDKNKKYNKATNDQVKGIISKYQSYCLRFALVIQAMNETNRSGLISGSAMERAIRLTEYFLGNMYKAIKILTPESPADKLQPPYNLFYAALPEYFTMKKAAEIAKQFDLKENTAKSFINRNINKLFKKAEHGSYEKLY